MEIVSFNNGSDLDALEVDWNRLCDQEPQYVPALAQVRQRLRTGRSKVRLVVATEDSEVKAIACFLYQDTFKRFEVVARKLFDLPVREISLFGSCVPGQPDEDVIRKLFQVIIDEGEFDVISLGEIFIGSPLHKVATSIRGLVAWRVTRQNQRRWMVRLPDSFEAYLSSLGPETRRHASRYRRKVESEDHEYRVVTRAADIPDFLRDAELISRSTYQWKLGYRLKNDDGTRGRFARLAEEGALRGYLLYLHGKPSAFAWGELAHRKFLYQAIGYIPEHGKLSPGTVLYLWLMRDLIENTDCEVFDFGGGGQDGYKSRLATAGPECARMQMARLDRPYSLLLFTLDRTLSFIKNAMLGPVQAILGRSTLKRRLMSALRPFGVGSY